MKEIIYFFLLTSTVLSCTSQTRDKVHDSVGGPCEGCEAIFEYGNRKLSSIDTLPKYSVTEPKLLITGTIYKKDKKTPAENVILYVYHTNRKGIYETIGNEEGWAKRHGYIRGWIKTGKDGKYSFYTFRPASYPNRQAPEHIHMTIKEPDKNEYYIDDIMFSDDPLLSKSTIAARKDRGGSGIVAPVLKHGHLVVKRDIVLGQNIPNYH